jgi:hypothetical protein
VVLRLWCLYLRALLYFVLGEGCGPQRLTAQVDVSWVSSSQSMACLPCCKGDSVVAEVTSVDASLLSGGQSHQQCRKEAPEAQGLGLQGQRGSAAVS